MEYQPHWSLCNPTTTPGSLLPVPENDHPSLPHLIRGLMKSSYMGRQGFHQGTTGCPTSLLMDDSQGGVNDSSVNASPTVDINEEDPKNWKAKRRAQNREAQRRFRERHEQQIMVLHKRAEELCSDYQTLLERYTLAASDVTRLIKQNDVLRSDARNLRQQLCLVFATLRRPQGRQSPETLFEDASFSMMARGYPGDVASGPLPNMTRCLD